MFASDFSTQISTISFRLKSSANTNLTVEFNGRDIRVADLKDKIAERLLSYSGGANLQLYETSGRLLSDGTEKVPAFSEILVVRTNEVQAGSNVAGSGMGGGSAGAASKEKTAGALGTINAAKKQAQEVSNMNRRSELEFGAELTQTHQQKMMMATSITNANGNSNRNNNGMNEKSEEEKLQELQDIVGRDMGVGSSTYGGRGVMNNNRGGFQNQQQQQQHGGGGPMMMMMNQQQGGFAAGKSIAAGGQAMAAAPSANYVCHICGEKGHFITHCPKANIRGNNAGAAGGARPTGGNQQRRFAQPTGIPESELERCSPEEAMFITRDGQYVRRKMVGLGDSVLGNNDLDSGGGRNVKEDAPVLKCMHCSKIFNEIKHLHKLPCNCAAGRIACTKCVDDGVCLEMNDDGPVCAKCGKEIDADEIVSAKLEDLPKSGQRRDRQ